MTRRLAHADPLRSGSSWKAGARASVPPGWRRALVRRPDLDRSLFAPDDVFVAVGQDGLVANVAKYRDGQPVVGVNPAPDLYASVVSVGRLGK